MQAYSIRKELYTIQKHLIFDKILLSTIFSDLFIYISKITVNFSSVSADVINTKT